MDEFVFVIDSKNKVLKVIMKKLYSRTSLASKMAWKVKKEFWNFPELVVVKSFQTQQFHKMIKETVGQKIAYLKGEFPQNLPLWFLEYKEFYELIKDKLYLQFLPNSRPIPADEKKIKMILKMEPGTKSININGYIQTIYIRIKDNQTDLVNKLKKYPSKNEDLNISLITYKYKKIKSTCAFNLTGIENDHYIVDENTQHLLKADPEVKNIIKYFNLNQKLPKNIENPLSINISNLFELIKKYQFSSKDIKIRIQTMAGKDIFILNIDRILEQSNLFIQKLMEARAQNFNYFIYSNDIFIFDINEIDKYEEKILDKLLNKELRDFVDKMKELNFNKTIDQNVMENLKKSGLNATLYDHQKIAVSWFEKLYSKHAPGAILADKMGAGKTIQTISFMSLHPNKNYLIIAPASVVGVWEQEIQKFNPELAKKLGRTIKIISYEKALSLKPEKTDILILDEAQKIKNNKSLTFKTISNIKKEFVIITTGTPIENKIDDLFSLLEVINSSAYDILRIFKKIYKRDEQKLVLKARIFIDPIFLQRDISKELINGKLNIIEEKIKPQPIELELQSEIIKIYSDKLLQMNAQNNHDFYSAQAILTGLLRLRQAVSYPAQLPEELINHFPDKLRKMVKSIMPSKAKNLIKKAKELKTKKEKMVIFTEFRGTMNYLKLLLEKEGLKVLTLSGSDSSTKRKIMIKEFQEGNTYSVFIIALKAGNSGITLTSANNVYIYDLFWNPAVLAQAIARVHRIGQDKDVNAYFSILEDTFDEKIYNTIIKKKIVIDTFEKGNENVAPNEKPSNDIIDLGLKIFNQKRK